MERNSVLYSMRQLVSLLWKPLEQQIAWDITIPIVEDDVPGRESIRQEAQNRRHLFHMRGLISRRDCRTIRPIGKRRGRNEEPCRS